MDVVIDGSFDGSFDGPRDASDALDAPDSTCTSDCCEHDGDCIDADPCTNHERCEDGLCVVDDALACSSCIDRDGDGYFASLCGGDDCDDLDPETHPHAPPICILEYADADCDGTNDAWHSACDPTSPVCEAAVPLVLGVEQTLFTRAEGYGYETCGGAGEFFEIVLDEMSDLQVQVGIAYDEEADPLTLPGHIYSAYLRPACGDPRSLMHGSACIQWDPWSELYPGSPTRRFDAARVPPGRYILEVRGANRFGVPGVLGMTVRAEAAPAVDPVCSGGAALSPGTFSGRTDGVDSFRYGCSLPYSDLVSFDDATERVHRVVASRRQRWTIRAAADTGERLRLALYDSCDPARLWSVCQDHAGGCPKRTLDVILEAGEHFLAVEGRFGRVLDYSLNVQVEDVGASCVGARVVSESGIVTGDTRGQGDDFRSSTCGDGAGADEVLELRVAASGYLRVALNTDVSFDRAHLILLSECGGQAIEQHNASVDAGVEPGKYYLVVDGAGAADEGTYELEITMPSL